MNLDAKVLRVIYRLARSRSPVNELEIAERFGIQVSAVRASMQRLQGDGFAELRLGATPRLTLSGLAVAAALRPRHSPQAPSWERQLSAFAKKRRNVTTSPADAAGTATG